MQIGGERHRRRGRYREIWNTPSLPEWLLRAGRPSCARSDYGRLWGRAFSLQPPFRRLSREHTFVWSSLEDFLAASADRYPDKTALVCAGARYTYAEIEARSNRFAHQLTAAGSFARRPRRVIHLPNSAGGCSLDLRHPQSRRRLCARVNPGTKADKLPRTS